mmetsp:Transcript_47716/g.94829  ORF Transcript_47716/g.94829 Transcript_47716/m.94829 type:complete len:106 (-) Transcript_47716:489-806(-)
MPTPVGDVLLGRGPQQHSLQHVFWVVLTISHGQRFVHAQSHVQALHFFMTGFVVTVVVDPTACCVVVVIEDMETACSWNGRQQYLAQQLPPWLPQTKASAQSQTH